MIATIFLWHIASKDALASSRLKLFSFLPPTSPGTTVIEFATGMTSHKAAKIVEHLSMEIKHQAAAQMIQKI